MATTFLKDPADVLDYVFDYKALTNGRGRSDWLETAETLSTKTVTADTGITVDSSTLTDTNTSVTVFISGGTASKDYEIFCTVTTSLGRTKKKTIMVKVDDQ
jgi:hypothetical protein